MIEFFVGYHVEAPNGRDFFGNCYLENNWTPGSQADCKRLVEKFEKDIKEKILLSGKITVLSFYPIV